MLRCSRVKMEKNPMICTKIKKKMRVVMMKRVIVIVMTAVIMIMRRRRSLKREMKMKLMKMMNGRISRRGTERQTQR